MILVFSGIGAMRMYPDQETMQRTFAAFLQSLRGQTDKSFRFFLSYHDTPSIKVDDSFIKWCPMSPDGGPEKTRMAEKRPRTLSDEITYKIVPYESGLDDVSRKVENSIIMAGRWALQHGIKDFWMMRASSDDPLAKDAVEKINQIDKEGKIEAIYNRTCHLFDLKTKEMAIYRYPNSQSCHAMKFRIGDDGCLRPDWFYMCSDHTLLRERLAKDNISSVEIDFLYCITTNTVNSLGGRPGIEKTACTTKIPLTKELIDRYGIEGLM